VSQEIIEIGGVKLCVDSEQPDRMTVDEVFSLNQYKILFPKRDIPMSILDVGAEKGYFTTLCASHGARVVAYEPNPASFDILEKNLLLNGLHAEIHREAVWHQRETRMLHVHESAGCSSFFGKGPSVEVPCESFDRIIGDAEWDFVKMDVEGAEYEILGKCSDKSLSQIKQISIELHDDNKLLSPRLNKFFHLEFLMRAEGNPRCMYLYGRRR
jgi:FkbM family methyltransferase